MKVILDYIREVYIVVSELFKILIPVIIVIKILEEFGAVGIIGEILSPVMQLVGLPESMGLVWAASWFGGIYGGMLMFVQSEASATMTVAQVTVVCILMLGAHNLIIEQAIASKLGVKLLPSMIIRLGGGLSLALILHHTYQIGGWLQQPANLLWNPGEIENGNLQAWVIKQIEYLLHITLIIAGLVALLKILRWLKIEQLMIWLLSPLFKLMGISRHAASLTIVGMTLGLAFGGALMMQEVKKHSFSKKDIFLSITLLFLIHSIIEDTMLVLLLGADLSGVLWARLIFAIVVVAIIARLMDVLGEGFQQRYLVK